MRLLFEWDANKARSNQIKHKVGFEELRRFLTIRF